MGRLRSVWQLIRRHKYLVVLLGIVLVDGLADDNCYLNRWHRWTRMDLLRQEVETYKELYARADGKLRRLDSDPEALERTARELYYMRRPGEDVFVVEMSGQEGAATPSAPDTAQSDRP